MNNNPNEINTSTTKPDKLTEKAFMHSIAVSVVCILICTVALCSATWAWFSGDVTSSENKINTGYCNITISVNDGSSDIAVKDGTTDVYTLEAGKTYTVSITSDGNVRSSYCKIVIGGSEYYTQQIKTQAPGNSITFTLAADVDTDVQIITRWGTYSGDERNFVDGGDYTIPFDNVNNG